MPSSSDEENAIQYLLQRPTETADFVKRLLAALKEHVRQETAFDQNNEHGQIQNLARIALNNEMLGGDAMHLVDA